MVKLELAESDARILLELLRSSLLELQTERVGTDNKMFHVSLVEREKFVMNLIEKLESHLEA
jgi:hypothetical protein